MADLTIADVIAKAKATIEEIDCDFDQALVLVDLVIKLVDASQANERLRKAMYSAADEIDDRSETLGHIAVALRFAAGRPDRGEPPWLTVR